MTILFFANGSQIKSSRTGRIIPKQCKRIYRKSRCRLQCVTNNCLFKFVILSMYLLWLHHCMLRFRQTFWCGHFLPCQIFIIFLIIRMYSWLSTPSKFYYHFSEPSLAVLTPDLRSWANITFRRRVDRWNCLVYYRIEFQVAWDVLLKHKAYFNLTRLALPDFCTGASFHL